MQTITKEVYTFDELDDSAKEVARGWYRTSALEYDWWDCTFEHAKEIGKILGIDIDKIYFSIFASQGDGACFEGHYSYAKGSAKEIKEHAPHDKELHRIATELYKAQRPNFYELSANVKQSGHYHHSGCTSIEVYSEHDSNTDVSLKEALRDFMNWIYKELGQEYDWLMSDSQTEETIIANEYTFGSNGARDY